MKIPVLRGPVERQFTAGVPRNVAILGGAFAAAMILGVQNLWTLVVVIPVYIALVVMYKKDPYFLEIILQHVNEDDYLEP